MYNKKFIKIDFNREVIIPRNVDRLYSYLNEMRKVEKIDDQNEIDRLVLEYQTSGSMQARDRVINSFLYYTLAAAAQLTSDKYKLADTIQEANEIVINALKTYDAGTGEHFITYATSSMINAIGKFCRHFGTPLTVRDEIEDEDPYEDIITDPEVLDKYRQVNHPGDPQTVSLNAPVGHEDEDSFTLADVLACKDTTVEDWERLHDAKTIAQVILSQLSDLEQRILCLSYGIGCRQLNDDYIAQQLDLPSKERVRQIRQFALTKALCMNIHH